MFRWCKLTLLAAVAFWGPLSSNTTGLASREPQTTVLQKTETSREAAFGAQAQGKLDPAAWGGNHAGQQVPEFVHGDECLFCHRNDIGPGWQRNSHGVTVRQKEDAPEWRDVFKGLPAFAPIAPQVEYFLGSRHRLRFL